MTDVVTFSPLSTSNIAVLSEAFRWIGHSDGWVMNGGTALLRSAVDDLANGTYGEFAVRGTSGLDVSFSSGEAVVGGAAIARDTFTTITLPANATAATVGIGWAGAATNTVKIGQPADFTADETYRPIYEFATDGSSVTSQTDLRDVGPQIEIRNRRYETDDPSSGIAVDKATYLGPSWRAGGTRDLVGPGGGRAMIGFTDSSGNPSKLTINYTGDYASGLDIYGPIWVYGALQVGGDHAVTSPDSSPRSISVGDTPPTDPDVNDIWIDTSL